MQNSMDKTPFRTCPRTFPRPIQLNFPRPIQLNFPRPIQLNFPRPIQLNFPRPIQLNFPRPIQLNFQRNAAENVIVIEDSDEDNYQGSSKTVDPTKSSSNRQKNETAIGMEDSAADVDNKIPIKKEDSEASSSKSKQYEVEKVMDFKITKCVRLYLIRWKGRSSDDDSWEPETTEIPAKAIEEFNKCNDQKKKGHGKKITGKKSATTAEENELEVKKIISMTKDNGTGERMFRIRWKGCSSANDTWELESRLSCDSLVQKYLRQNEHCEPKKLRNRANLRGLNNKDTWKQLRGQRGYKY